MRRLMLCATTVAAMACNHTTTAPSSGTWIEVPYASSNFAASAGAWTVDRADQFAYRYAIDGDVMHLQIKLRFTSTDAAIGHTLLVRLPDGYRTRDSGYVGPIEWSAPAGDALGVAFGRPEGDLIALLRDVKPTSTAWPASVADALFISYSGSIAVRR